MTKIEKITDTSKPCMPYDNTYISANPLEQRMIDKINELVDVVNKLENNLDE